MNIVNIKSLIAWIKKEIQNSENPWLQKLQGAKILAEPPITEPKGMILQCTVFPPTLESEVSKIAILRCNLSSWDSDIADFDLLNILESLEWLLCNDEWVIDDLGFGLYKLTEAGGSPPLVDQKWRKIRVKDFYLHYTL